MKVVWFTDFFPSSSAGEIVGGVEARCFFVSKHLRKVDCRVQVVARVTNGRNWAAPAIFGLLERVLFTVQSLFIGLRSDFDLVEGTNFATYPTALVISWIRRKPLVLWYADSYVDSWVKNLGPVGVIGEIVERVILALPGIYYLAISESTKNKLISHGVPSEFIRVVPCGYDVREIKSVKRKPIKQYDVIAVSRLLGYKRIADLVTAIAIVKKKLPDIRLAIVGQGPEEKRLGELISRLGLAGNVTLLGYIPSHRDVLAVIASGKIFCHPSLVEGFGIVVVEAAALGVPAVVTDLPVLRDVTRGGLGVEFFPGRNVEILANKLTSMLTNKRKYRQKVKETSQLIKPYYWEKIAKQTLQVYKELLD